MYESISYAELKSLPKEQKPDAWKELKSLYSSQKELAEKLGVSPAIVYNMISRYVKDESTKGKKAKKLGVVEESKKTRRRTKKQDIQIEQEQIVVAEETKPVSTENNDVESNIFSHTKDEFAGNKKARKLEVVKPKKTRKAKQQDNQEQVVAVNDVQPVSTENSDIISDSFSIVIKKMVSGEDAQVLLNGIGSTLLKNQKYSIEIKISEK